MNTIIEGLLSQKPGRGPEVGQIKTFLVEQRTSKCGKPWTKVKNATPENGGSPYRILAVQQTDHTDQYGNVSFNIQIEPAVGAFQQAKQAMSQDAPQTHEDAQQRDNATDPIRETREHLMQAANLQVLCIKAVNGYVAGHCPEIAQTSEQFQGLLAQLFIYMSSRRTNDGVNWFSYVDKMPTRPLDKDSQ